MSYELPQDQAGVPVQLIPAKRVLASTRNTALTTAATDFTLQTGTKLLRLRTTGASVYINFVALASDTVTTSSFDCFVPADWGFVDVPLPENTSTINAITDTGTVDPFIILEY